MSDTTISDQPYADDDVITDSAPEEDTFLDPADDPADEPVLEPVPTRGRRRRDQRGMATAEYAVGTVAAVALVTALINVFRNKEFLDLLLNLVMSIFRAVMAAKGLGL